MSLSILPTAFDRLTLPGFDASPVADAGHALIAAARRLGDSPSADILRAWCVPHLFQRREQIFDSSEEPLEPFRELLASMTRVLTAFSSNGFAVGDRRRSTQPAAATVERVTGEHYGQLFRGFSPDAYWGEAEALLRTRLVRNGIDVAALADHSVLDAGCGGGRYTAAWRRLGAKPAVGLDISPINVVDARARAEAGGLTAIEYQEADVLTLPLADDSFQIVFSNGVLHHTRDWERGVRELVRVLTPGGFGWLYLIEHPGGLFWDAIEILREVTAGVEREVARRALGELGLPDNRIFYFLDHVMVPINLRLTAEQIEACLRDSGATQVRRLTHGADFDRIERIHLREPYAATKFGVGEHRYVFSK